MYTDVVIFCQDEKKAELAGKAERARDAVAKLTSAIEQMKQSRDEKMADINRLQQHTEVCYWCPSSGALMLLVEWQEEHLAWSNCGGSRSLANSFTGNNVKNVAG